MAAATYPTGPFKFVGLTGSQGQVTGVRLAAFDGYHGPQALLISNGPYDMSDVAGLGRQNEEI